jgi:hypothetical protein
MIAYFRYDKSPEADCISVELTSAQGVALGIVSLPPDAFKQMERLNPTAARSGDPMALPFALSYGVLAASITGCKLSIAGEKTLWPEDWGMLIDR